MCHDVRDYNVFHYFTTDAVLFEFKQHIFTVRRMPDRRLSRLSVADKGWSWAVMAASFGSSMITGCFQCAVGVIHNALLERFDEDVEKTSWASSLYLGMLSITGVLASVLINRFSCRVTTIVGAVMMVASFITCAYLPSLNLVIVFYGVFAGVGTGLVYSASVVVLGFNFHRKRNIATGIAVSGCGVGTFVLAPAIEAAREEYGNNGFFFIVAAIALQGVVFGCLFFPSELESEHQQMKYTKSNQEQKCDILKSALPSFGLLKNIPYLCLCVSMFLACAGVYLVYVHLPRYAIEMGASSLSAAFLISVSGVCDCVSRILTGMAAQDEDIDEIVIYFGTFGLLGLSTLLVPLYATTYTGQLVYAVLFGMYSGCCYSVMNTIIIDLVGVSELANGVGIYLFFCGVGSLIGPPIAGAVIDHTGSYENSFLLAGACITMAAVLGLTIVYFKKTKEQVFTTEDIEIPSVTRSIAREGQKRRVSTQSTASTKTILNGQY
ncbi:monocarboxylate transporter 12-like [Argopecten irradians]|uniref:monocarboxylate transporter 12-like n=1 Tax=Argopecten irradians TaxID=31199 RepID=UPI0037148D1D